MKEKLAERLAGKTQGRAQISQQMEAELEVKLARLRTPLLRISGASARGDTRSRSRGLETPLDKSDVSPHEVKRQAAGVED